MSSDMRSVPGRKS